MWMSCLEWVTIGNEYDYDLPRFLDMNAFHMKSLSIFVWFAVFFSNIMRFKFKHPWVNILQCTCTCISQLDWSYFVIFIVMRLIYLVRKCIS